jgi:hypothetical protein
MNEGKRRRSKKEGSALLLAVLMLLMMGLIGFAALQTTMRDLQVTGAQFRSKVAFFAAEAGVAQALQTMRTDLEPTVTTTTLSDSATYPFGRPTYSLDPAVAVPIQDLGVGMFPGMNLQIGQNGSPAFSMHMYGISIRGTSAGGGLARIKIVSGALDTN